MAMPHCSVYTLRIVKGETKWTVSSAFGTLVPYLFFMPHVHRLSV